MTCILRKAKPRLDETGATLIEFAFVAPVFLMMLMGVFDLGYTVYMKTALTGAVQDAARSSTLETGMASLNSIDTKVKTQLMNINPGLDPVDENNIKITRANYLDFDDVGQPENFTDSNGDGVRDSGECFEDVNGNDTWDSDIGGDGVGGPNDVVLYTVSVTYDRLFPLWSLIDTSQSQTLTASTVLKNQPFGDQLMLVTEIVCT